MVHGFKADLFTASSGAVLIGDLAVHEIWTEVFRAVEAAELASKMSLQDCSKFLSANSDGWATADEAYSRRLIDLEQGNAMSADELFRVSSHFCHKLDRETPAGSGPNITASYMALVKLLDNAGSSNDEA